jgi:hypothetical protein
MVVIVSNVSFFLFFSLFSFLPNDQNINGSQHHHHHHITMAKHSGLQYEDVLIGAPSGETPGDGKIVGFEARVMIGDQVMR